VIAMMMMIKVEESGRRTPKVFFGTRFDKKE
jgi:hypothetical protein